MRRKGTGLKLYEHTVGRFTVRCQFENPEEANDLFQQLVPAILHHIFKVKNFDMDTDDLPAINGAGFRFNDKLVTVFGEGTEILVLDEKGIKTIAGKIEDQKAEEKREEN
jgi:hypothetical protein